MSANDLQAAVTLTAALIAKQQAGVDAKTAAKLFYQVSEALRKKKPTEAAYQNLFV